MPDVAALAPLLSALERSGGFFLRTGVGGGGTVFASWLLRVCNLTSAPAQETDDGLRWPLRNGGHLLDRASLPVPRLRRGHGVEIVTRPDVVPDLLEADPRLLGLCAEQELGFSAELANWLTLRYERSTIALDALRHVDPAVVLALAPADRAHHVDASIRGTEAFRRDLNTLLRLGGARVLDVGRVVHLLEPQEMHLGDEWAELATAGSGRSYSVADISGVLSEFSDLFHLSIADPLNPGVRAANRYVSLLFSGLVPISNSEYYQLFKWMSRRAVASLHRTDGGDQYVRRSLPDVALRAGALPELLRDGPALLAADVVTLTEALERSPDLMVLPGAKAALLHSHRLQPDEPHRVAQMELALRRMSLTNEADRIAAMFPDRPWRPVWSSTTPTHIHRIIGEERGGALCLSQVPDASGSRAYVGFASGRVARVVQDGPSTTAWLPAVGRAEVRGLDAVALDGTEYVCTGSSDGAVHVYAVQVADRVPPATVLLWSDRAVHQNPLSALALSLAPEPEVLSGGVGGTVERHRLLTGEHLGRLVNWGAEIRAIRPLEAAGRRLVVVAAVDGRIGVLDACDGSEVTVAKVAAQDGDAGEVLTPTCLDAAGSAAGLVLVVGCATGHLFTGTWTPEGGLVLAGADPTGVPLAGVNDVRVSAGGDRLYVARNDGVWLRLAAQEPAPIKVFTGHVGPVMALIVLDVPDSPEEVIVTGGVEGTVRLWRHAERLKESLGFLRLNRHRGPVRSVQVRPRAVAVDLVTGGSDGDLRVWPAEDPQSSRVISRHDGSVTACLILSTPEGDRLVSGAADGSIRLADPDAPASRSQLLGIAHEGVTTLVPAHEAGLFWSGGMDGAITRWDMLAGVARGTVQVSDYYGAVLSMVALGGVLYVGGQNGSLTLVDARTLRVREHRPLGSAVTALAAVEGTGDLAIGLASGEVSVFDASRDLRAALRPLHDHHSGVTALSSFGLHGQAVLASVGRDRRLKVTGVSSRAHVGEIDLEGFPTALHTSGRRVAVATTAGATLFEFAEIYTGQAG